jgi:hypothetical protein
MVKKLTPKKRKKKPSVATEIAVPIVLAPDVASALAQISLTSGVQFNHVCNVLLATMVVSARR